jgi:hypothetical protein
MTDARRNVGSVAPEQRMDSQRLPSAFDCIEDAVCCRRIVECDVAPNVEKVFVGLFRANNRMQNQTLRFNASKRRRASALTSSIVSNSLNPLSIPSCTSSRNSSTV